MYFNFLLQEAGAAQYLSYLPILFAFVVIYFMLFLPMQKQKKQQQKMLSELQNGNVVVTSGGIIGTIIAVNPDETLVVKVRPDNIKLQIARSAVAGLVTDEAKK